MKKSKSSMPRFDARDEDVADRPPGLDGTDGPLAVEAADPAAALRVAMAVGKTKDGSELPANLRERSGGSVSV